MVITANNGRKELLRTQYTSVKCCIILVNLPEVLQLYSNFFFLNCISMNILSLFQVLANRVIPLYKYVSTMAVPVPEIV